MDLLVDPVVSRTKFDREVKQYRSLQEQHLQRGWFLISADFPEVFVVFANPKLKPPPLIVGALLNFTNYDFLPPSVRLVNPFTRQPYLMKDLPTPLPRQVGEQSVQPLMQAYGMDDIPFLCLPGVREYHQHPGHTGDHWLLHRGTGEGTLFFILDQIHKYGVEPIVSYNFNFKIQVTGFALGALPK